MESRDRLPATTVADSLKQAKRFAESPLIPSMNLGSFSPSSREPGGPPRWGVGFAHVVNLGLALTVLLLVSLLAWPLKSAQVNAISADLTAEPLMPYATSTPSPLPPTVSGAPSLLLPTQPAHIQSPLGQGTIFLSIGEGGYYHLFIYQPLGLPFTRLTNGAWDDITPALSPDGTRLAFASNRAGQWDLYIMNLPSGDVTQVTNSPAYDAAPTWSPDGLFLAYETYIGNLEIALLSLESDQPPILLSQHPAVDTTPTWSPSGRQIAFVSTRSGEREVWLADLNATEEKRFTNLSQSPGSAEAHPVWSPDGHSLAWSSNQDGRHNLITWDGQSPPQPIGSGDWPAWSPDGQILLTALDEPNQAMVSGYHLADSILVLPPLGLPGPVAGLSWGEAHMPEVIPGLLVEAARATPAPLWQPALTPLADIPAGRQHLVPLEDVQAPYPQLHDLVDEAFQALRGRVAAQAGWDFLASLENAYVPLTVPLAPGMGQDWLYTGRAFAFNPLLINAGWLAVIPEPCGGETYWRVYLRARYQDGSQGMPLHDLPWDFNARYSGDSRLYDQGGSLTGEVPQGYWVDFTTLAQAYGWERLPALTNWRSAYPAARFNEFVQSSGLDWRTAIQELYPPEVLVTPTAVIPPTLTATPTPRWTPVRPTPTRTRPPAKPSQTPTPGP